MNLLDEHVHVVAPPVGLVTVAPSVGGETDLVRELLSRHGIGVEIVIHVDGVHIVAVHDVAHDAADVLARLGIARVEVQLSAVLHEQLRVLVVRMQGRERCRAFGLRPVRVDPGMQLHAPLVAFGHHKLQRVPHRRGRLALHTGQEAAPRLVGRGVQRVAFRPHLEDDGVDAGLFQMIQLTYEGGLQGRDRHPLELSVHALNPRAPELALRRGCLRMDSRQPPQEHGRQRRPNSCFHDSFFNS